MTITYLGDMGALLGVKMKWDPDKHEYVDIDDLVLSSVCIL